MTDSLSKSPTADARPRDAAGNLLYSATKPAQFSRAQLADMTSAEINAARVAGQLDDVLAGN